MLGAVFIGENEEARCCERACEFDEGVDLDWLKNVCDGLVKW